MIGDTASKARAKAAVAVALALASLLPTPALPPADNRPTNGEVRDGWTWKEDPSSPKGGYWWRFRAVEGQAKAIPFTDQGRTTRLTTVLPAVGPNTSYPARGQFQGAIITPARPAVRLGITNTGCTSAGG